MFRRRHFIALSIALLVIAVLCALLLTSRSVRTEPMPDHGVLVDEQTASGGCTWIPIHVPSLVQAKNLTLMPFSDARRRGCHLSSQYPSSEIVSNPLWARLLGHDNIWYWRHDMVPVSRY